MLKCIYLESLFVSICALIMYNFNWDRCFVLWGNKSPWPESESPLEHKAVLLLWGSRPIFLSHPKIVLHFCCLFPLNVNGPLAVYVGFCPQQRIMNHLSTKKSSVIGPWGLLIHKDSVVGSHWCKFNWGPWEPTQCRQCGSVEINQPVW